MRFVQGLIVGAVLLLGAAYVHDTGIFQNGEKAKAPFVNWDTLIGIIARW